MAMRPLSTRISNVKSARPIHENIFECGEGDFSELWRIRRRHVRLQRRPRHEADGDVVERVFEFSC